MRVSDRLDFIEQIASELQARYTFHDVDVYLKAFGIGTLEGTWNSKRTYSKAALAEASEDLLFKIGHDLELENPTENQAALDPPKIWQGPDCFRLFISHISKDKDKAKRLRDCLASHSIGGFVAHEDIQPTLQWQSEIEKALSLMDAMVAIHTKGFSGSNWTQQEIGFALGRGVKVISFKMGEDPTGFISKHQALPRQRRKAEDIAVEIEKLLASDKRTSDRLTRAQFSFETEIPF